MTHLTRLRISTTKRMASAALPDAFIQSTYASAANAAERTTVSARVSRRRLSGKAMKLAAVAS